MTNAGQPTIEERLSRLENIFANIGETVVAQSDTIDVLVANINQLTENVSAVTNRVDILAIQAEQDRAQAAEDRQQAAVDRQEFRSEIRRIWEYLLQQGGNGNTPPQ
jgi:archaellum component FlaC